LPSSKSTRSCRVEMKVYSPVTPLIMAARAIWIRAASNTLATGFPVPGTAAALAGCPAPGPNRRLKSTRSCRRDEGVSVAIRGTVTADPERSSPGLI
jgi:hypothetical protein